MIQRIFGFFALLILAAACQPGGQPQPVDDTPEQRASLAAQLARLAADHGQFDQMLDEGAEVARRAGSPALELELERPLSDDEQARMRGLLRGLLTEFVSSERWQQIVATAYAENFTADELARVLAFYDSELGYKIIVTRGPINERIKAEARAMFDLRLEEFIERADAVLGAEFGTRETP
jgi:hypothetical protein